MPQNVSLIIDLVFLVLDSVNPIQNFTKIRYYFTLPRKDLRLQGHQRFMRRDDVRIELLERYQTHLRTANNDVQINKLEVLQLWLIYLAD